MAEIIEERDEEQIEENTENEERVETSEVDLATLTELISDKDKELKDLRGEIDKLKKANAQMVVQLTAGRQDAEDIGKTIVDFCDTRK